MATGVAVLAVAALLSGSDVVHARVVDASGPSARGVALAPWLASGPAPSSASAHRAVNEPVLAGAAPADTRVGTSRAPDSVSGPSAEGIPTAALAAYQQAANRTALMQPSCGLVWPLLAAIGRVESNHGRFAGAVLYADGRSDPPVIGIPLDGQGTALIRDTDGGRLDGDRVYDRAVGSMQFIPSTWASWGVDANHDGVKDPFNIFDAAAAAAAYLCAAGRNLRTYAGQVQAVRSYNNSDSYISMVLRLEREYAGGVVTVPVPLGEPRAVAPRHRPHPLPPVDPGRPRGLSPVPSPPASTTPRAQPSTPSTPSPTPTCPISSAPPSGTTTPSSPATSTTTATEPSTGGTTPTETPSSSPPATCAGGSHAADRRALPSPTP